MSPKSGVEVLSLSNIRGLLQFSKETCIIRCNLSAVCTRFLYHKLFWESSFRTALLYTIVR